MSFYTHWTDIDLPELRCAKCGGKAVGIAYDNSGKQNSLCNVCKSDKQLEMFTTKITCSKCGTLYKVNERHGCMEPAVNSRNEMCEVIACGAKATMTFEDQKVCNFHSGDESFKEAMNRLPRKEENSKEQGRKDDDGKLRWTLIPIAALRKVVEVLDFGAKEYGVGNWVNVPNAKQRYSDAMMRHITDWLSGEKLDPKSGKSHLAHAACCILFLLYFEDEKAS